MEKIGYRKLLYIPNLIGYLRLLILIGAFYNYVTPGWFIMFYSTAAILDAFDGYAARKFNQVTNFGAWLDVVIDNIGRGLLWAHIHPLCHFITVVEWITFASCGRERLMGETKKEELIKITPPNFLTNIVKNNFRNRWGVWAIAGIHVLPIWIYGIQKNVFNTTLKFLPSWTSALGLVLLICGRILCLIAELWNIWIYLCSLLI